MNISATRERKKRKHTYKGHSGVDPEFWFLGRHYKEGDNVLASDIRPELKRLPKRINVIAETGLYVDNKTGSVLSYENHRKKSNDKMSIKVEDFFVQR